MLVNQGKKLREKTFYENDKFIQASFYKEMYFNQIPSVFKFITNPHKTCDYRSFINTDQYSL